MSRMGLLSAVCLLLFILGANGRSSSKYKDYRACPGNGEVAPYERNQCLYYECDRRSHGQVLRICPSGMAFDPAYASRDRPCRKFIGAGNCKDTKHRKRSHPKKSYVTKEDRYEKKRHVYGDKKDDTYSPYAREASVKITYPKRYRSRSDDKWVKDDSGDFPVYTMRESRKDEPDCDGYYCKRRSSSRRRRPAPTPAPAGNLVEVLLENGLTTLVELVSRAGLADAVASGGPFTIFAPSNQAFENIPRMGKERLLNEPDLLSNILTYHVVPNKVVMSTDLVNGARLPTLLANRTIPVSITKVDGQTKVVVAASTIKAADLKASNGVVHILNEVMFPPAQDIVQFLRGNPSFSNSFSLLYRAVMQAGMDSTDMLGGAGPFTIFAPTDDAFKKHPNLDPFGDNNKLFGLLANHIVPGAFIYTENLGKEKQTVQTISGQVEVTDDRHKTTILDVAGEPLQVSRDAKSGTVTVTQTTGRQVIVTLGDFTLTNGVIHVINDVLLPESHQGPDGL